MTHITSSHLHALAKLCAIKLDPAQEQKLLGQLENILAFVGQLQECDITGIEETMSDHTSPLREGVVEASISDEILSNVQHPLMNQAIALSTSTNK